MSAPAAAAERAQVRLREIRADISARLWSINQGMSSPAFNGLIDQMALVQFNGEQNLVAELNDVDRRLGESDRRAPSSSLQPTQVVVPAQLPSA